MTISVVIGTRDRPQSLLRCLRALVDQTQLPDEVLIVDDGHLDAGPATELLQGAGVRIRYFNKSHDPGLTKSRNLGIRESTGSIVLFIDDDVVLEPGYLKAIARVYREYPHAAGVGGRLVDTPLSWPKRMLLRAFLLDSTAEGRVLPNGVGILVRGITSVTPVDWLSGCNMSYRREVFDRFLFDEHFAGNGWGDDRDFSFRVSRECTLLAAPDATLHHLEDPRGRSSPAEFGRTEVLYLSRFFAKHMPQRLWNRAALWWAFAGILVKNLASPRRLPGNLAGMASVWQSRAREDA
jgi:GT2 family glycosyltransferase